MSFSDASSVGPKKNACETSETGSGKSDSQSIGSRLSLDDDFEEELKQYAAAISSDEEGSSKNKGNNNCTDDEGQRNPNKNNEEDSDSSTTTVSSLSSYEFRLKSKRIRTENMTVAEVDPPLQSLLIRVMLIYLTSRCGQPWRQI